MTGFNSVSVSLPVCDQSTLSLGRLSSEIALCTLLSPAKSTTVKSIKDQQHHSHLQSVSPLNLHTPSPFGSFMTNRIGSSGNVNVHGGQAGACQPPCSVPTPTHAPDCNPWSRTSSSSSRHSQSSSISHSHSGSLIASAHSNAHSTASTVRPSYSTSSSAAISPRGNSNNMDSFGMAHNGHAQHGELHHSAPVYRHTQSHPNGSSFTGSLVSSGSEFDRPLNGPSASNAGFGAHSNAGAFVVSSAETRADNASEYAHVREREREREREDLNGMTGASMNRASNASVLTHHPGYLNPQQQQQAQSTVLPSLPQSQADEIQQCWDWLGGRCQRGALCKYSHAGQPHVRPFQQQLQPAVLMLPHPGQPQGQMLVSPHGHFVGTPPAGPPVNGVQVCHQFNKVGVCQWGNQCRFIHLQPSASSHAHPTNELNDSLTTSHGRYLVDPHTQSQQAPTQSQAPMTAFLSSTLTLSHLSHLPHNTHIYSSPHATTEICRFYARNARCKYGITCKFEHISNPGRAAMIVDSQFQQQMQQQQQGQLVQQQFTNQQQGQGQNPSDQLKFSQLSQAASEWSTPLTSASQHGPTPPLSGSAAHAHTHGYQCSPTQPLRSDSSSYAGSSVSAFAPGHSASGSGSGSGSCSNQSSPLFAEHMSLNAKAFKPSLQQIIINTAHHSSSLASKQHTHRAVSDDAFHYSAMDDEHAKTAPHVYAHKQLQSVSLLHGSTDAQHLQMAQYSQHTSHFRDQSIGLESSSSATSRDRDLHAMATAIAQSKQTAQSVYHSINLDQSSGEDEMCRARLRNSAAALSMQQQQPHHHQLQLPLSIDPSSSPRGLNVSLPPLSPCGSAAAADALAELDAWNHRHSAVAAQRASVSMAAQRRKATLLADSIGCEKEKAHIDASINVCTATLFKNGESKSPLFSSINWSGNSVW